MRDYGKVAPQFWTGQTGKALKAAGPEAVIVALYLMTSPHANMIGLYYMPKLYLAHETGLGEEGACKGLERAIEAGFCSYDEASEHVFVHAMARFQIADSLKADDKRCKGIENELAKAPKGALELAFRRIYAAAFNLKGIAKSASPLEGASKPLGSQEQEQEQEQDQEIPPGVPPADPVAPDKPKGKSPIGLQVWIDSLPADEDAIAADDPIFDYAASINLPAEYIELAWAWFKTAMQGKRKKDWRMHFRNAVRNGWPKYWWPTDGGGWRLSPAGEQAKRALEAQA